VRLLSDDGICSRNYGFRSLAGVKVGALRG